MSHLQMYNIYYIYILYIYIYIYIYTICSISELLNLTNTSTCISYTYICYSTRTLDKILLFLTTAAVFII